MNEKVVNGYLEIPWDSSIGDVREQLALQHQRELNSLIDKYKNKREDYYLLYFVKKSNKLIDQLDVFRKRLKGTWGVLSEEDFKIIWKETGEFGLVGSMCYKIDNRSGRVLRMWSWNPDVPRQNFKIYTDTEVHNDMVDLNKKAEVVYTWGL